MKKYLLFILATSCAIAVAQTPEANGGEYLFRPSQTECLSSEQRERIHTEINKTRVLLQKRGILKTDAQRAMQTPLVHPLFIWPVTKNPSAPYSNVWSISNHVDHNLSFPNQVQDFNCGQRTYDTSGGYNHAGIDIFTWPFSWYQFQNNQAFVVAAADGIIVFKDDNNFDMNCSLGGADWNAIYLQHADGSMSWYGHMKTGSLTTKGIGDTVTEGEFLGVVGSSGNSTGPHLHFEVYNAAGFLVDTYTGNCNTWTSSNDSWWQTQKPYIDPKINAVLTHNLPPTFANCPTTETVNLTDSFAPGQSVIAAIYLADQVSGTTGFMSLRRPDGTLRSSFSFNFNDNYSASYWYWTYAATAFDQSGDWTFSLTYLGNTVTHSFFYGTLGMEDFSNAFSLAPNPVSNILTIQPKNNNSVDAIQIFDMTGKKVYHGDGKPTADVSSLSNGIYLLQIVSDDKVYKSKFVKE